MDQLNLEKIWNRFKFQRYPPQTATNCIFFIKRRGTRNIVLVVIIFQNVVITFQVMAALLNFRRSKISLTLWFRSGNIGHQTNGFQWHWHREITAEWASFMRTCMWQPSQCLSTRSITAIRWWGIFSTFRIGLSVSEKKFPWNLTSWRGIGSAKTLVDELRMRTQRWA